MPFNIHDFKSQGLTLNGARPTLFEITMSFPAIAGNANIARDQIPILAKASSLPQSTINEVEVGYFGRKIKLIGDRTYTNWACTFYNDENFSIRNAMMNWHQGMNSTVPNLFESADAAPSKYKRDITIRQFSKGDKDSALFTCTLIGAFPVVVGPITLDWDATNQIEMFDIEFAYDYWVGGTNTPNQGALNQEPNFLDVPAAVPLS